MSIISISGDEHKDYEMPAESTPLTKIHDLGAGGIVEVPTLAGIKAEMAKSAESAPAPHRCKTCDGVGALHDPSATVCPECEGTGLAPAPREEGLDYLRIAEEIQEVPDGSRTRDIAALVKRYFDDQLAAERERVEDAEKIRNISLADAVRANTRAETAESALADAQARIKTLEAELSTPILVATNRLADSLADARKENEKLFLNWIGGGGPCSGAYCHLCPHEHDVHPVSLPSEKARAALSSPPSGQKEDS